MLEGNLKYAGQQSYSRVGKYSHANLGSSRTAGQSPEEGLAVVAVDADAKYEPLVMSGKQLGFFVTYCQ
jgi:hypothetical protein